MVCILSGGNISSSRIARVIDRGMAAEGRLCKFSANLPDVPGAMAKLLAKVHEYGADVKSFVPERAWMRRDIFTMSVSSRLKQVHKIGLTDPASVMAFWNETGWPNGHCLPCSTK